MADGDNPKALSEPEGALLNVIRLHQPVTPYRAAQIYGKQPATTFDKSKGRIYPMIRKFNEAGLIEGSFVEGDGRGTEVWSLTDKGMQALHDWALGIETHHMALEDPIQNRLMAFDLLTSDEKLQWIIRSKQKLSLKLDEINDIRSGEKMVSQHVSQDYAAALIRAKMDYLDKVLYSHSLEK